MTRCSKKKVHKNRKYVNRLNFSSACVILVETREKIKEIKMTTKKKNKKTRKFRCTRRTARLETHFGQPAKLVSKLDGRVIAEGDEAMWVHRELFDKRISGAKESNK